MDHFLSLYIMSLKPVPPLFLMPHFKKHVLSLIIQFRSSCTLAMHFWERQLCTEKIFWDSRLKGIHFAQHPSWPRRIRFGKERCDLGYCDANVTNRNLLFWKRTGVWVILPASSQTIILTFLTPTPETERFGCKHPLSTKMHITTKPFRCIAMGRAKPTKRCILSQSQCFKLDGELPPPPRHMCDKMLPSERSACFVTSFSKQKTNTKTRYG